MTCFLDFCHISDEKEAVEMQVENNENEHYEGKILCKVVDNGENLDDLEEAITNWDIQKQWKVLGKDARIVLDYMLNIRGNKETFVCLPPLMLGCHLVSMLCYN